VLNERLVVALVECAAEADGRETLLQFIALCLVALCPDSFDKVFGCSLLDSL
jgi:hypothetical protein